MSRLPADIFNYEVPQYLPTLDLYYRRFEYPEWETLYQQRLTSWVLEPESWLTAAEEGDIELLVSLLDIGVVPEMFYEQYYRILALVNLALDNFHWNFADYLLKQDSREDSREDMQGYLKTMIRMGAYSDYWARKFFDEFALSYVNDVEDMVGEDIFFVYSENQREFLQMLKRILGLGLIDQYWMIGSIKDLQYIDDILTQIKVVQLYRDYFPDYDFQDILGKLYKNLNTAHNLFADLPAPTHLNATQ